MMRTAALAALVAVAVVAAAAVAAEAKEFYEMDDFAPDVQDKTLALQPDEDDAQQFLPQQQQQQQQQQFGDDEALVETEAMRDSSPRLLGRRLRREQRRHRPDSDARMRFQSQRGRDDIAAEFEDHPQRFQPRRSAGMQFGDDPTKTAFFRFAQQKHPQPVDGPFGGAQDDDAHVPGAIPHHRAPVTVQSHSMTRERFEAPEFMEVAEQLGLKHSLTAKTKHRAFVHTQRVPRPDKAPPARPPPPPTGNHGPPTPLVHHRPSASPPPPAVMQRSDASAENHNNAGPAAGVMMVEEKAAVSTHQKTGAQTQTQTQTQSKTQMQAEARLNEGMKHQTPHTAPTGSAPPMFKTARFREVGNQQQQQQPQQQAEERHVVQLPPLEMPSQKGVENNVY
eukprot:TRINITY_DN66557_c11_g4_i4.p1 TRINITY_DN66557_c11_g4~~TRINITY_DN66557_c11_g4_i4.p1  ORF type:complete len:406 (-),score=190.22 TRINITY_DN66557_c11_g4_i4:149-1327(-)